MIFGVQDYYCCLHLLIVCHFLMSLLIVQAMHVFHQHDHALT